MQVVVRGSEEKEASSEEEKEESRECGHTLEKLQEFWEQPKGNVWIGKGCGRCHLFRKGAENTAEAEKRLHRSTRAWGRSPSPTKKAGQGGTQLPSQN